MTDIFKDDETEKSQQGIKLKGNFKNKILAELKAASDERGHFLAEEERRRKEQLLEEAARKQAEAEEAARLAREAAQRAEEEERQAAAYRKQQEAELAELARMEQEARRQAEYEAYLAEEERLEQERLAEKARLAQQILEARQGFSESEEENSSEAESTFEEEEAQQWRQDDRKVEFLSPVPEFQAYYDEIDGFQNPTFVTEQQEQDFDGAIPSFQSTIDFDDLTEDDLSVEQLPFFELEDEDEAYLPPKSKDHIAMGKKAQQNRLAKKISLIVASVMLISLLAIGGFGVWYVSSAVSPLDKTASDYIQVEIPEGSSNRAIGKVLEEAGLIKSGTVFNYYTKFKNYTGFQSGYYNFQKSMSLDDIAKLLQEGGTPEPVLPALGKVVIPEGYTLAQIAKAITSNGATEDKTDKTPFKESDFLELVEDADFIARMTEKYPNLLASLPDPSLVKHQLEGYLFPATYAYYETTTLEGLVEEMLAAMDGRLAPYYGQIAEQGKTVNDILSLASLVEKEGQTDDDRRQIASVFYNRLAIEMPLQSNIAILYAMDKLGDKTTLAEDAEIDTTLVSPYNIYTQLGLTPGPVDSPSLSAIEASIDPAKTDYLYFVADVTTGVVHYAETFEEHDANVAKYVNSHLD